jgi:hypothetical protein
VGDHGNSISIDCVCNQWRDSSTIPINEDEHKIIRTKDKAAIDNLIAWMLSLSK